MPKPLKAIRVKCLECSEGSANEVKLCPIETCALYPFRFGKNPNIKLTGEQKERRLANLKKNHETNGMTGLTGNTIV